MTANKPRRAWGEIVGFLLLAAALAVVIWPRAGVQDDLVPVGTPLPQFMVEGWVNTEEQPSAESLRGEVVVVDCWATWCPPCREALPALAEIHSEYQGQGVRFVGISPETGSARKAIEKMIENTPGFDWPVGYGANPTLDLLGIQVFPTLIVFNRQGTAIWSSSSHRGLRGALDQALSL